MQSQSLSAADPRPPSPPTSCITTAGLSSRPRAARTAASECVTHFRHISPPLSLFALRVCVFKKTLWQDINTNLCLKQQETKPHQILPVVRLLSPRTATPGRIRNAREKVVLEEETGGKSFTFILKSETNNLTAEFYLQHVEISLNTHEQLSRCGEEEKKHIRCVNSLT